MACTVHHTAIDVGLTTSVESKERGWYETAEKTINATKPIISASVLSAIGFIDERCFGNHCRTCDDDGDFGFPEQRHISWIACTKKTEL
ncbi:hypothetical protein N7490_009632 [Penicillium lividum]|nr:hypothetical protein N7490_009632 [Penicillium lividum]